MFKAGEKVTVRSDCQGDNYGIGLWRNYVGKIYTIERVSDEFVTLKEDFYHFIWSPHMLRRAGLLTEKIEEYEEKHEDKSRKAV